MILNLLILQEMQNKIWRRRLKTAENGRSVVQIVIFCFDLFLLTHHIRFASNIFTSRGVVLNLRYTLINEKLKGKNPPEGWFKEKKNMVSIDSKLHNSVRITIKFFFGGGGKWQ